MNKNNKPRLPLLNASRLPNSHPRFHLRNNQVYDWRSGRVLEARELVDLLNQFNNLTSEIAQLENHDTQV